MTQLFEKQTFSISTFDRLIVPTNPLPFKTNQDNFNLLSSSRLEQKKSITINTKKIKIRPSLDESDLILSHEVLTRLDEKENNAKYRNSI